MSEQTLAASNAANNYTLKNNEDGSFAIKKATTDVLTISTTGKVTCDLAEGLVQQADLAPNVAGNGPAFSAYQATSQSQASGSTFTEATNYTERFDTGNCFNPTTGRFTPTVAGYYAFTATILSNAASVTGGKVSIAVNNAENRAVSSIQLATSLAQPPNIPVSSLVYLNGSGAFVSIYAGVTGGTASWQTTVTDFTGYLVRAA